MDLADDDIRTMAQTWTQLHRLSILSERCAGPSKVTLNAFLPLLESCPLLDSVGITFDPTPPCLETVEAVEALRRIRPDVGCLLFKISVMNCCYVEDPLAVAHFLHSMFPESHVAIEDDKTDIESEIRRIESWHQVRRLVRVHRRERRESLANMTDQGSNQELVHERAEPSCRSQC